MEKKWQVYDLEYKVYLILRDVWLCEKNFPYLTNDQQSPLYEHINSTLRSTTSVYENQEQSNAP